ncbi:MAG: energy-dependent translational throttle protein EttA [Acidobacteria bacterium]|nr:energy-dependent translational throttle protein EttA [Acidobacteriota bacterium]
MNDQKIIFSMVGVNKTYPPNRTVIKNISLSYFYGAKIGLLGLNGAGKSTVLRIMAGIDDDFQGERILSPGHSIGYLEQEPQLDRTKSVRQIVEEGAAETVALLREYDAINEKFAEPMDVNAMEKLIQRQGDVQDKIDAVDGWNLDTRLNMAMDALRCPPAETQIDVLSGGEKRRVALCRLLITQPDILLLDEPTNHLDAESVAWLERHLQDYKGTVIAVTHDRYFLDNVAGWIMELDRGEGIPWRGNYSSWLDQKEKRLALEERQDSKRRKTLARELEWISMSPKARHAKSKSRIKAYESLLNEETKDKERELEIFIPSGPRLGDVVIRCENVRKQYGDKLLVDDLNFNLPKGALIGVIGANGAGKTTLFRMITGQEKPDAGQIELGSTVKLAYVDQEKETLNADASVFEAITDGNEIIKLGNMDMNGRAYCSRFNFSGTDQSKKVRDLSGGERNRLHLARMLKSGANVLLLDEPTNDLDVNTLRALEDALDHFAGSAIVISHDRWFLDRVATHILAFEGNSQVVYFDGSYEEYEENRKKRLGDIAPTRVTYKKLEK